MMTRVKLASINLFVQDIARSTVFYNDVLGLELDRARSEPEMAILDNGGCKLGLQNAASMDRRITSTDGIELGFEVEDVDEVWQKLKKAGADVLGEPVDQGFGRTFDARDPDGYQLTVYKLF